MRLFVLAVLLASGTGFAQHAVPAAIVIQPGPNDIVIGGNDLARDVNCNGNAVYVQGLENEVQVHGTCRYVRVQGDRNRVWIERATTVPVDGNDNTVLVASPETTYSSRGNGNHVEKAKR